MKPTEADIDKMIEEIYGADSKEDAQRVADSVIAKWDGETVETFAEFKEKAKPMSDFWTKFLAKCGDPDKTTCESKNT